MTAARISHSCQRLAGSPLVGEGSMDECAVAAVAGFAERPWICLGP